MNYRKCTRAAFSSTVMLVLLAGPGTALAQFPWDMTDAVLIGTTNGTRTGDDVIGALSDSAVVYGTQTGSTSQQAILRITMAFDGSQMVTGGVVDYIHLSSLVTNSAGLKSVDIFDDDTLFYTLEEGGADNDGLVGRATSLAAAPLTHTEVADLTNVRTGATADFDPEGIAINRSTNSLYVMTDDGPNTDVAKYAIDPGTGNLTLQWVQTVAAGGSNGNDGTLHPDGRVLVTDGTTSVTIYAVVDNGATAGAVTDLLGGATSGAGRDTPQDLLVFDGFLYLAWESGIIDAFDLSALSATPDASVNLDGVTGVITTNLSIGGLAVTLNGHLVVSTRAAGGSTGEFYVFNNMNPIVANPTTTDLASSQNPSNAGDPVTFTATVNGDLPTGDVSFEVDGNPVVGCGAVALTGGGNSPTANCAVTFGSPGTFDVVATYAGDAGNAGSTSGTLQQVVEAGGGDGGDDDDDIPVDVMEFEVERSDGNGRR